MERICTSFIENPFYSLANNFFLEYHKTMKKNNRNGFRFLFSRTNFLYRRLITVHSGLPWRGFRLAIHKEDNPHFLRLAFPYILLYASLPVNDIENRPDWFTSLRVKSYPPNFPLKFSPRVAASITSSDEKGSLQAISKQLEGRFSRIQPLGRGRGQRCFDRLWPFLIFLLLNYTRRRLTRCTRLLVGGAWIVHQPRLPTLTIVNGDIFWGYRSTGISRDETSTFKSTREEEANVGLRHRRSLSNLPRQKSTEVFNHRPPVWVKKMKSNIWIGVTTFAVSIRSVCFG